jgi:hypothetical protein
MYPARKGKLYLVLNHHEAMKAYGEWIQRFMYPLSRHLGTISRQVYASATLSPWKEPDIHLIGGWVGPRADGYDTENMFPVPGLELRPLNRRIRCQSVYRMSYIPKPLI